MLNFNLMHVYASTTQNTIEFNDKKKINKIFRVPVTDLKICDSTKITVCQKMGMQQDVFDKCTDPNNNVDDLVTLSGSGLGFSVDKKKLTSFHGSNLDYLDIKITQTTSGKVLPSDKYKCNGKTDKVGQLYNDLAHAFTDFFSAKKSNLYIKPTFSDNVIEGDTDAEITNTAGANFRQWTKSGAPVVDTTAKDNEITNLKKGKKDLEDKLKVSEDKLAAAGTTPESGTTSKKEEIGYKHIIYNTNEKGEEVISLAKVGTIIGAAAATSIVTGVAVDSQNKNKNNEKK